MIQPRVDSGPDPGSAWPDGEGWQRICRVEELQVERGATALAHGSALAVFRTSADEVFVLGNHDPVAKASVLARGIVGSRAGVPLVFGPTHRYAFDLRTGRCVDDPHVAVPSYPVRIVDGVLFVGPRQRPEP